MTTSKWIDVDSPGFNLIKDGRTVSERVTNKAIDNIRSNLQYLKTQLDKTLEDSATVVAYNAPVNSAQTEDIRPGAPVYWDTTQTGEDGVTGVWSLAYVKVLPTSASESADPFHWEYDTCSYAAGIVLRRNADLTVDVALSGSVQFPLVSDDNNVFYIENTPNSNFQTPLDQLFDMSLSPSFSDGTTNPSRFSTGVYYTSKTPGVLTQDARYTITTAVVLVESRVDPTTDNVNYYLRFIVCPEGFGGAKFHVHSKTILSATDETVTQFGVGSGTTTPAQAFNPDSLPDEWFPVVQEDGEGVETYRQLDVALSQIQPDSNIFPYTELLDDGVPVGGDDDAVGALLLYNALGTNTYSKTGWLSAADPYFTEDDTFVVPDGAIWGYRVRDVLDFLPSGTSAQWNPPAALDHIILTQNGVPVPNTYYTIDEYGLWWMKNGVEHAPIQDITGLNRGPLELLFIDNVSDTEDIITGIDSETAVVDVDKGVAMLELKDRYMEELLMPVLAFNPIDDLQRASVEETKEALCNKLITPVTAKVAAEWFAAVTESDEVRTAKSYSGHWDTLMTSGFYSMSSVEGRPLGIGVNSSTVLPMLALVGRFGGNVFQFCFDTISKRKIWARIRSEDTRTGSAELSTYWGPWMLLTRNYEPVYLPGYNYSTSPALSYLDFDVHANISLVSPDEQIDVVCLPSIASANALTEGYVDGFEYTFVNEMNASSINSTLIIKLTDKINGVNCDYLVCPGQSGTAASHHMGRVPYSTVDDVPAYVDCVLNAHGGGQFLVIGDCEAPQAYGSNSITLRVIGSRWVIGGGSGVWFPLTAAQYAVWDKTLESLLITRPSVPLRLTSMAIREQYAFVDYTGSTGG